VSEAIIRQASADDAETIASIYNYYVENTVITFEEEAVTLRNRGIRAVLGGAAMPNDASVALHEGLGFERVATFHQVVSNYSATSTMTPRSCTQRPG